MTSHARSASNPLPHRVASAPATKSSTNLSSINTTLPPFASQPNLQTLPTSPTTNASGCLDERPAGWTWDVTPAEKASSDRFFDTLDPWKHGYIEGETAVPFMSKSKLSEHILANIWCVLSFLLTSNDVLIHIY